MARGRAGRPGNNWQPVGAKRVAVVPGDEDDFRHRGYFLRMSAQFEVVAAGKILLDDHQVESTAG